MNKKEFRKWLFENCSGGQSDGKKQQVILDITINNIVDKVFNNKHYIAKKDTWFKEGTECVLLEDYEGRGLYNGTYIVGENENYDTFWHKKGHNEGDEVNMNEVCSHDEFYMVNTLSGDNINKYFSSLPSFIIENDKIFHFNLIKGNKGISIFYKQNDVDGGEYLGKTKRDGKTLIEALTNMLEWLLKFDYVEVEGFEKKTPKNQNILHNMINIHLNKN